MEDPVLPTHVTGSSSKGSRLVTTSKIMFFLSIAFSSVVVFSLAYNSLLSPENNFFLNGQKYDNLYDDGISILNK